ncbi:YkgJ family cysteine cluster protein [Stutzerimonas chloritidismutans]|uniref:YkgJ family cysteine cluster protein n=1 Tax=Stutzerimonas chloritidismutans TaxID=203192 RepID=UPI003F5CF761
MDCRAGCGACCVAPSISTPLPGMPNGKAAGERCLHLTLTNLCGIFGSALRPPVCDAFKPDETVCGASREEAIRLLGWLENETS